jgi:hypothetical protein
MKSTITAVVAGVLLAGLLGGPAFGLGMEQVGPDPADRPTRAEPGWPAGIVDLPRHGSRVYSSWVNGNEHFYFDATVEQMNEMITAFGKARMRDHVIQIVSGPKTVRSFFGASGREFKYNVALQIVAGIALSVAREGDAPDLPLEPRLTIVAGDDAGVLQRLTWPEHAILDCRVPGVSLESKRTRPQRQVYYGRLAFDDGSPPEGFVRNVCSRITLWERGNEDGIEVARVDHQGYFRVPLSIDELGSLWGGGTRLTFRIGNWLDAADPNDLRVPAGMLTVNKDKAEALLASGPTYYWGRILFEDGSGPVLNPGPWPGAEIMVEFPYAGSVNPDKEGYFKVALTKEQVEAMSKQKVRKNIYVPEAQRGRSSAKLAYPAELLSLDKSTAGVVKIPLLDIVPEECKPEYNAMGNIQGEKP